MLSLRVSARPFALSRGGPRVALISLAAALVAVPGLFLPSDASGATSTPRVAPTAACPWVGAVDIPAQQRAEQVVAQMTLAEKASMAAIQITPPPNYQNTLPGVARLCIPTLHLQDGPAGVAASFTNVTQMPAPIALAATWNPELAALYGDVIASEAKAKGIGVLQSPNINIARVPQNGRNFEAFGEDPLLTGRLSVAQIRAIEARGVMANVKHFAANNQETNRLTIDEHIDQRALNEIYFPAFQASVQQGRASSAMCAYNQINGTYSCQSPSLLSELLRGQWGFTGFVRSDLGAVHDLQAALLAGTDIVKPTTPEAIIALVDQGQVGEGVLTAASQRLLTAMFAAGLVDQPLPETPYAPATSSANRSLAARVASAGTVLLRNAPVGRRRVLPFGARRPSSIAVIGAGAYTYPRLRGEGSSAVDPWNVVTPLAALRARAKRVPVRYASGRPYAWRPIGVPMTRLVTPQGDKPGLDVAYYDSANVLQRRDWSPRAQAGFGTSTAPTAPEGLSPGKFKAVWSGYLQANRTGRYRLALASDDGGTVALDGRTLISGTSSTLPFATVDLRAGTRRRLTVTYTDRKPGGSVALQWQPAPDPGGSVRAAARLAGESDVAVVFAQDYESESVDRTTLDLTGGQNRLIEAVAARNPRTVVVLNTGGPVLMPWLSKVAGVVQAWYPGEMDGQALAAVLWGNFNPSGRLPQTFPAAASDVPTTKTSAQWPGVDGTAVYSEGLNVGYRGYDAAGTRPLFPFGYGQSYTRFRLSSLTVTPTGTGEVDVTFKVTNVGTRLGGDTPQIYLSYPAAAGEPPKVLREFAKVVLAPGETREITRTLSHRAFQYWDPGNQQWQTASGDYTVLVGENSRDLPLRATVSSASLTGGATSP